MKQQKANINLEIALNSSEEDRVPKWVNLIPAGPKVTGKDGRTWYNTRPDAIVRRFKSLNRAIMFDYNHASENHKKSPEPIRASGWIEDIATRDDGSIWAKVEWTPQAVQMISDREYRYVSPVIYFHKNTRVIAGIASAGLVGDPNFNDLKALNSADHEQEVFQMNKVTQALGLVDDASEESIVAAIDKLKGDIETAQNAAEQGPDLEKFVPREDYNALEEKAKNSADKLAELEKQSLNGEIDSAIEAALNDGKITPATESYHRAQCSAEGGLERFRDFVKTAPAIGDDANLQDRNDDQKGRNLTDEQKAICSSMNLSEDDFKAQLEKEAV